MCGILGTINRSFGTETLDLLWHRGPDDSAMTQDSIGGQLVTLGHRRLSIVDLSPAGRQPLRTACDKYTIVFNGEIYNHRELRNQTPGVRYRGHSDTETILNFLAQHSIAAVSQFNGIFALGLVDAEKRKLFLARDAFGVKPLYYWADHGSFLFSSEIRPLSTLVDDSIDLANLAELLRLRYLPAPDTLFKKIHKVRPGHIVEVDFGSPRLSVSEYPFVEPPASEAPVRNGEEAVEQYGFLMEQAVKRQLMSDVDLGVLLSGGVDSALIASIAQKHSRYRMKAFTVGFNGHAEANEIADAEETARLVGLDHYKSQLGSAEFFNVLPRVSAIVEEPLATTSMVPMFYLASLASGHGKVMLSGQGADEAMGGYRRYQAELMRSFIPRWAVPILRGGARLAHLKNDAILRGLDSMGEQDDVRRFEAVYSVFSSAQIGRLIGSDSTRAAERIQYFFDLRGCSRQRRSVQRMMALDLRMNLADDLLLYTDKITMHHSIECRVPFLDRDLVRFVESLPCRYRVGVLRGKALHKQFAKRLLPVSIIRRKKKGFLSPAGTWFKATNLIRDTLLDPTSRFASYFDLAEVGKILQEHSAGMNRERHIFLLLSLYYWMAEHRDFESRTRHGAVAARR